MIKDFKKLSDRTFEATIENTTSLKSQWCLEDLYSEKEALEKKLAQINELIKRAEDARVQRGY